eukprot:5916165-Pyramimonas_sp.AAC.2
MGAGHGDPVDGVRRCARLTGNLRVFRHVADCYVNRGEALAYPVPVELGDVQPRPQCYRSCGKLNE